MLPTTPHTLLASQHVVLHTTPTLHNSTNLYFSIAFNTYATIFLVLMSLGIALTRLKVISWAHATILGLVRVILGPVIGFILIKVLDLYRYIAYNLSFLDQIH